MTFEIEYPVRASIMKMPDEELVNELTIPIRALETRWDMDIRREALRRILKKLIKLEKKGDD